MVLGLRMLKKLERDQVLSSVRHGLSKYSPFVCPSNSEFPGCVVVITGKQEGVFSWLAVNFASHNFRGFRDSKRNNARHMRRRSKRSLRSEKSDVDRNLENEVTQRISSPPVPQLTDSVLTSEPLEPLKRSFFDTAEEGLGRNHGESEGTQNANSSWKEKTGRIRKRKFLFHTQGLLEIGVNTLPAWLRANLPQQ